MRVLFITDNFPPEVNAPATRTYEHGRRWVKAGMEVTIVTCAPNFPQGRIHAGYRNRLWQSSMMDGMRVVRVWSYMAPNEGIVRRTLDHASFAISSFVAGLFERADVIVATSPQFFTALSGYGLSLFKRRPWIFELRDIWPDAIAALGALKRGGTVFRILEALELFLYRRASRVVCVSPAYVDDLKRRGIDPGKLIVITNGADLSAFHPRPRNEVLRGRLGIADRFVLGYVGTHGLAHGLKFIVESLKPLDGAGIHALFVGDGAEKANVRRRAADLHVTNASFHDSVPKEEVPDWLAACDAVLVPLIKSDTFKTSIPSKIFEAGAMGLPILLGVDGQARHLVEEFGAGLYFEPENAGQFQEAAIRLCNTPLLRQQLSEGGLRLAAAYDRNRMASVMLDVLYEMAFLRQKVVPKPGKDRLNKTGEA